MHTFTHFMSEEQKEKKRKKEPHVIFEEGLDNYRS
jgi:hypothetical protein